ncbi:class I adenylate-forming enzyme family protein [Desertimonas flava]|jgi:acyl-CoA synthetase (AMP-forming)/AMP-acid ligase II|uniref:class I adenylate-forming enzyme family protein n=1 Tax=Desertimonas flava TaxID=2064846 RepID=UPI000E34FAE0|nr:AMP-binding protein [Desertimonas flava]
MEGSTDQKVQKEGRVGAVRPFDESGVTRGADGVLRYDDLPPTIGAMFLATATANPDAEAIVELDGRRLTYGELHAEAGAVAGGLAAAGIEPGDRVAIILPNGAEWVVAFFGAVLAGAVVVPVNTRLAEPEIDYILEDSGASYVFRPGESLPSGDPVDRASSEPTDLAAICYTSGTTGRPKGAMLSHENFMANCETCRRIMHFPRQIAIRNLVSVPLFHVTGLNSQLLITVWFGGTTVIMPAFEVQRFLRAIEEERIDVLTSVPAIFWLAMSQPAFAETDVSSVRWLTYGGAPMPPDVIAKLRSEFPNARLGNGFGLTETSSVSTFLPHEYCDVRPETVGFAAPVIELDLFEESDGVGELLIRGQNVVAGYWNKPEQSAETFVDHWLHTGDLARIDADGYVQIVDRKKDMVNRGGENVYCVEVENALAQHPDVFEVAVVGVPDSMMGEKVGAVIVPTPGAAPDAAEVARFARTLLADFKVPQYVAFRDEPLPRNPNGKVLKPVLREHTEWGDPLR